jgi:hypothetical protein
MSLVAVEVRTKIRGDGSRRALDFQRRSLLAAARGDLRLLTERDRRAALRTAVVTRALAQVVFARKRRMVARLVSPRLLKLDGLLALQRRILE